METKQLRHYLPKSSFLVDRQFFNFDDLCYSVCLLTFGYYNEKGKLCYIYHLLIDGIFTLAFSDYARVLDYLQKLA